jgi:hypothetical protein
MSWLSDLFKRNKDVFVPQNINFWGVGKNTSKYLYINSKQEIYVAYNSCPTLKAIVEKCSDVFTRATQYIENNGKIIENHYVTELFKDNELKEQFARQLKLFDEVFILKDFAILGNNNKIKKLHILEAQNIKVIASPDNNVYSLNPIRYEYTTNGKTKIFSSDEIIWISNLPIYQEGSELKINHTLYTAEQSVNVIISAYDVRNGLNRKKGGFHILTRNQVTNPAIAFNNQIDEEQEVERVQGQLSKYSYSNADYNTLVTNVDFKAQTLSFQISSMELNEGIRQAKAELCDLMNFPLSVLNSLEGQTFNNVAEANKMLYQQTIIPTWILFDSAINQNFTKGTNDKFISDYSNIEALQPDKKTELEKINIETQAIIDLNNQIKNGIITKQIASYLLINLYNYSEEAVKFLLIENINTNE